MRHYTQKAAYLGLFSLFLTSQSLIAFENTKVLPKGIRSINLRTLYTEASTKTDPQGNPEPLAEPLWQPLRLGNVLSGESGLKRKQLEALMLQQGWDEEMSLGDFHAELDAQINVWAPIFAYGITERLTFAVAVPIYSASTDIQAGFRANQGGERFLAALTDPTMNNTLAAREAAENLSNAVGRLNEKLIDNDFEAFDKWNSTGLGDITVAAKMLVADRERLKAASSFGFVIPTGRTSNPDILTDLPFGDGQWDIFTQLTFDQILFPGIFLNQFAKYTYQAPGQRTMRLQTFDERIEVEKEKLDFKLGDKLEAGLSIQFEQESTGLISGLGLEYMRKNGDRYDTDNLDAKNELQRRTDQEGLYWKARLGYSTLPAFRRNEFAVPLTASIEYRKQYESRNLPQTDFTQVDISIFF